MRIVVKIALGLLVLPLSSLNAQTTLPFDAHREVAQAIASMRKVAMNKASLDWATIEAQAQAKARDAKDEADLLPVYASVLDQLDDHGHSMQLPTREVRAAYVARYGDKPIPRELPPRAQVNGIGRGHPIAGTDLPQANGKIVRMVSLPGLNGPDADGSYAQAVYSNLTKPPAACGYILDLRGDTGGNMFPMVTGLSPLLGDGYRMMVPTDTTPALVVVDHGVATGYEAPGGPGEKLASTPGWQANPALAQAPVALLLSANTASAGEDLAVQFIGRPNTRSFGALTRGEASANIPVKLDSGTTFMITSGLFADRNGRTYIDGLKPDVAVADQPSQPDPIVAAAASWLARKAACR